MARSRTLGICIGILYCIASVYSQTIIRKEARLCAVNDEEFEKCENLMTAIEARKQARRPYPDGYRSYEDLPKLICTQERDRFACMEAINANTADLVQLDPGMGYTAGEYFTMLPLVAEKYNSAEGDSGFEYLAVAVVKVNSQITIKNLKDKKACHTGVGRAAGWVYPISTLIDDDIMPITECNVPVKSAAAFFGDMCAPNGLARYYNPFGNNPATICQNCAGAHGVHCTGNDPYAGYYGAFQCMETGHGDVAFVRHSTLYQYIQNGNSSSKSENDFKLLCLDGTTASPRDAADCNWGIIPSHIVMTSAIREEQLRSNFKELLELLSLDFGKEGANTDIFKMFDSVNFGKRNLLFTDETHSLLDVKKVGNKDRDTYYTWVGEDYRRRMEVLNSCPLSQARWCVITRNEMRKCENMIMAFAAKGLKPDLNCILGNSIRECMNMIRSGDADLMSADAADVYVAGKIYGLVPIAYEDYSGYNAKTYYAVAVARRTDSHLTIFNLKSRRTCHSGVMTAAGWVVPVDKLIETGQIQVRDCNVYYHVGQFFSKSCVPGVLNDYYNAKGTNPINLCEACASGGPYRCQRDDEELYYGNSGAFRCLTETGGDVAFTKHTTVRENTDGRNRAEWARNRRSDDYELMCNDGTRQNIDNWADCNMGDIPANAILTAGFKTKRVREIYWTLMNFAQQFFASDSSEDFSMFDSEGDRKDLVFQDSTVRLVALPEEEQSYQEYLGSRFMRAMERMENIDCITDNSAALTSTSLLLTTVCLIFNILKNAWM